MESNKMMQNNLFIKQKQTHRFQKSNMVIIEESMKGRGMN